MTNQRTPEQRGWILDEHGAKDHPLGDYRILWSSKLGRAIRAHFTAAPVQGGAKLPQNSGATEEQIEAGARAYDPMAWAARDRYAAEGSASQAELDLMVEYSIAKSRAVLSAAASAHPADERHDDYVQFATGQRIPVEEFGEHHDAEEREAESEDHATTARATGDRGVEIHEQVRRAVEGAMAEAWSDSTEYAALPEIAATRIVQRFPALAAPVEVDAEKLAEVLREHFPKYRRCGGCSATWHSGRDVRDHQADVVAEWLRGEGR